MAFDRVRLGDERSDLRCGRRIVLQRGEKTLESRRRALAVDVHAVVAVEHPARDAVLRGDAIDERTKPDALHHAGDADANRVHPGPT